MPRNLRTLHYTRIILCASLLLVGVTICSAQPGVVESQAFSFGVKGIANIAGIANQNNYGQNEMDYTFALGFGGGAMFGYHLNGRSTLIAEVTFSQGGQQYDDSFKGRHFEKEVSYNLISVPLAFKYKISEAQSGYTGVGAELKPKWYLLGGLQIDRLLSPEIDWYLDGQETEFLPFVLEGGNPNQAFIEMQGTPASDAEFFVEWDVQLIAAGGFELHTSSLVAFSIEIRGGIGLTDLNGKTWRIENHRGVYGVSRNSFVGLHAGVSFLLTQ